MELLNIGFGNYIATNRVVAIVSPESAPVKRLIQQAKESELLINGTFGRKTRSVIVMDSSHVVLSSLQSETIQSRLDQTKTRRNDE